ncbi:MAG: hypothetical protein ACQ5SW_04605 [Sphaerochaetaceae bacterium]
MYLDVLTQPMIDPLVWYTFPDEEDGVMSDEIWKCGPLVCTLLKNPSCRNGEQLVSIPYSMVVKREGAIILAVSLEQEDLRELSYKIGISLKALQEEYQTKGTFSVLRGYVYSKENREDLGVYDGDMDLQSIRIFFLETVCDTFDILSEPMQIPG